MFNRFSLLAIAAAGAFALPAAAAPIYGSAALATYRSCTAVGATDACDGTGPGQRIVTRVNSGGVFGVANTNLTLADGSYAQGKVGFGVMDLPILRGLTSAVGNERMNINDLGFQSFTYRGPAATEFSLAASLHIVDSSGAPSGGALPGGAIYSGYVAIWDPTILAGISTADDISNNLFYAPCGVAGVLAVGQIGGNLAGGEQTFSVSTTSCSGSPLMLTPGQEVLAVAGLQLPANRGGFADSSHTFVTMLDPTLSEDVQATLRANLVSGAQQVPEPAAWALMILGFGGIGGAMRRRRTIAA